MPHNRNKGNILLVANWKSDVGYAWWLMENFWISISEHFTPKGMMCHLIYPEINNVPEDIASSDIITHELDLSDKSRSNLLTLYQYIKRNNIRYIYLSDYPAYSWFYILLRLTGIRKIVIHDHTPGDRTRARGLRKAFKKSINSLPFLTADHIIATTDFVRQRHLTVNCIPRSKCSVARNGIHPFDLHNTDAGYVHSQLAIDPEKTIVITTGRASLYKGIDFFIRCADELINNEKLERLHFVFCGDGPDLGRFKSLCRRYGLDGHFTFAGKRSDLRQLLPSCDIAIQPSHGEVGYSLSILEYMSAGLATIVPDLPSTSLATRHEINGLVYRHNDVRSACAAIKKCLNKDFRRKITHNAINDIKINYTLSATNSSLLSILESVYLE